jgi:hypothetical protein
MLQVRLGHTSFRKHWVENVLGTPFLWSAQWLLHHDEEGWLCRRNHPGTSTSTESWGTCLQMTSETPLPILKASYI